MRSYVKIGWLTKIQLAKRLKMSNQFLNRVESLYKGHGLKWTALWDEQFSLEQIDVDC